MSINLREIKQEILDKISELPDHFYIALAGELFSVFGRHIFEENEEFGHFLANLSSSTAVGVALYMTCEKLGLTWVPQYVESLEWYDSDKFYSIIIEKVIDYLESSKSEPLYCPANSYFIYLLEAYEK